MQGVLTGFATIGVIIAVGFVLAHLRIVDGTAQMMLSRLAFFVATPALMVTLLGSTDVSELFSKNLAASLISVLITAAFYIVPAQLIWKRTLPDTVIGTFGAVYVNAGNLGLPIAAYALGDASLIAPMLLTQIIVMQPIGLTILDFATKKGVAAGQREQRPVARAFRIVSQPFRNPLLLGSLLGLLLSVTGWRLPTLVHEPLVLLGGMSVPAMLIAYGISLRLGPLPGRGEPLIQIGYIVFLKLVVLPLLAYLLAKFVLQLDDAGVLAVVVVAALPTAQNIFTHANRYQQGIVLARDSIFMTTVLSVPVVILVAALLA